MLCYSNRIKQGFRLAQTLVYTVLITQHIACYPERQDTRAIREYRAPEVKDVHDTLHHNLRGPPHPEGGGSVQPRQLDELGKGPRGQSGELCNPGYPGPRLNRVSRTPIEVGRELSGRQPHDQQEWPNCGQQEASVPTKGN